MQYYGNEGCVEDYMAHTSAQCSSVVNRATQKTYAVGRTSQRSFPTLRGAQYTSMVHNCT